MTARSFDRASPRPAPAAIDGTDPDGRAARVEFSRRTLVVAVKEECDGCRGVVERGVQLDGVDVVLIAATPGALAGAAGLALVAPSAMDALGLRWPPAYALVDPDGPRVVAEGTVFSPEQVAAEVAAALA